MPKDTPQVDHRAEALSALDAARRVNPNDPEYPILLAEAESHSNLAIAEGQERVAEALEAANQDRREQRASAVEELRELVREVLDGETNSPGDWNPRARRTLAQFDGVDEMGLPRRGPAHLDNRPRRSEAK